MNKEKKTQPKRIYRSESDQVIAGVSAGLGEYFEVDPTLIRIAFTILMLFGGGGFILYMLMWIVVPKESDVTKDPNLYVKDNTQELKNKAESLVESIDTSSGLGLNPAGLILVAIGVFFLLTNFGLLSWLDFGKLWPLILIAIGFIALRKRT